TANGDINISGKNSKSSNSAMMKGGWRDSMKSGKLMAILFLLLVFYAPLVSGESHDCHPIKKGIAILKSEYTRNWFINGPAYHPGEPWGEDEFNMYWQGWAKFLDSISAKYTVIGDSDVENLWTLLRYKLVILPNVAAMSRKEVKNIELFVKGGGGVIATYGTSWLDEKGNIVDRGRFALWELWGIPVTKEFGIHVKSIYVSRRSAVTEGIAVGSFIDYGANANTLMPTSKGACSVSGFLVDDDGKITSHPAIVERRNCLGRVVYFSFSPEYVYSLGWANDYMKLLMANAVHYALGK
ncbi:MAG: beta-galactosidase trimerization domain-containing protein, partial [Candidatus Brockarchaeota archaeon]|nr:beta-galactosidase trimerization domain-containing protein [Candidatus Brockarchaeota archaeon]